MQPVIGITMCLDENKLIVRGTDHNYVRREYAQAVRDAGGYPIYIDSSLDPMVAAKMCDGVVISGGEDVDPTLYGQENIDVIYMEPRLRTDWERQLIDACDEWNRPILGVCYGEQLLNVHYGGTIIQDIEKQCLNPVSHGTSEQAAHHEITFERDFLGFNVGDKKAVAARHHQAIDRLAPGFEVVARTADGVIEAIAGKGHFGVQWHTECDDTAPLIYGNFIKECASRLDPAQAVQATPAPKRSISKFLSRFK